VQVSPSAQRTPWASYQVAIGFGSAPARVDELTNEVLRDVEALRANGPTADEIQRVRETGIRELETAEKQNRWWLGALASALENGEDPRLVVTAERALYDTLTPQLVQRAAQRYLNLGNYARFTLLPESR
jgi:zinc protease